MQLLEDTKHYKTKNQYNKENTNTETCNKTPEHLETINYTI